MTAERVVLGGVVHNGVVVPDSGAALPEGLRVDIVFGAASLPPELAEEFAAWDEAADDAWRLIEDWEREPQK